jgi:hypothetical protein
MRLASVAPSGSLEYSLYSAPENTEINVDTVNVCNRSATDSLFRISISNNSTDTTLSSDYQVYDMNCPANDTIAIAIGLSLYNSQEIRVYADSANLSFTAFGKEIKGG